jgi:putative aldouronate transport system substrate-binding protein
MEQGAFLDLTPYVTGNAANEFKNLATFPDYMWNNVKFRGKIYGVPKPLQRNGNIGFYRADWAAKVGKGMPKSTDELHDLLVAFAKNDPDGNGQTDTWGLGRYGSGWAGWDDARVAINVFGAPFNWRKNADGTMTHQIETPEYRQALEFLRRLYADGAYHPDAGGMTFAQAQNAFIGGKTGIHSEGIGNFYSPSVAGTVYYKIKQANPQAELTGLLPSGPGGAKAVTQNTPGSFGFVGIPASIRDTNRVKELLRVLDYLASPFGSEEWHFLNYGLEGVDYQVNNGVPTLTDRGTAERGDLVYLMAGMPYFYYPQTPEVAETAQKLAHEVIKLGTDDPSWPLYSPTNVAKAAELNQFGFDRVTAIVTGREPLSALDAAIAEWKSRGGEQIRKEFEQALKGQ